MPDQSTEAIRPGGFTVSQLPRPRFVDRFVDGDNVYYAYQDDHSLRLYRVTGTTEVARGLLPYDAVIYDGELAVTAEWQEQYRTVDLYDHHAGRVASLRADRVLDEPAVTLTEVERA